MSIRFFILIITALGVLSSFKVTSFEAELDEARILAERFKFNESLDKYRSIISLDNENVEALFGASFMYSQIGNTFNDEVKREHYFESALTLAKSAYQLDSTFAEAPFVLAVALSRNVLEQPISEQVAFSREIKRLTDKAIHFDADNDRAWYLLGKWHMYTSELNFIENLAVDWFFGGLEEGSKESALMAFERAQSLNPDFILYQFDKANTLIELDKKNQARSVYQRIIRSAVVSPDDPWYQKQSKKALEELNN